MKQIKQKIRDQISARFFFATVFFTLFAISAKANPLDLATIPLANSPTIKIQPNLLFVLDDSGSMTYEYTPDYMSALIVAPGTDDKQCKDSGDDGTAGTSGTLGDVYPGAVVPGTTTRVLDMCTVGDVPYMNSDMNNQYYNPAIRYEPARNGDGTSRPSQTDPTAVLTDAYGLQRRDQLNPFNPNNTSDGVNRNTVDLTSEYPDRLWCTIRNPNATQMADTNICRRNTAGYQYPDDVFKYGRRTTVPDAAMNRARMADLITSFGGPYYFDVIPTEYCADEQLKFCVVSSVPTGAYLIPAKSRWCDTPQLANCQSVRTTTFKWPRYIGNVIAESNASGSLRVTGANRNQNATVSSIRVNGIEIMGGTGTGCGPAVSNSSSSSATTRNTALAAAIAARINSCISSPDYTASSSGIDVVISAALPGTAANGPLTVSGFSNGASVGSISGMSGGLDNTNVPPYVFVRTNIDPSNNSYQKSPTRTDCAGSTCTYAEEITNFGNWYAYYRSRMQAMKTTSSIAFKDVGEDFRVGFMTINPTAAKSLRFDTFSGTHKINWYNRFFGIPPGGGTPLRQALSRAGRVYANKDTIGGAFLDPVEYSCQQNFTLLTSDGYWNGAAGVRVDGSTAIGNQDGPGTPRPMFEGASAVSNTLADVAKYYRDTDLRTPALSNCIGAKGVNVCQDPPPSSANQKQTMVTLTLGLGLDGELGYTTDYKTATSGDFYDIRTGTRDWTIPAADSPTGVDDLWHAAVNGDGTYFSAKDPAQLARSLKEALASIEVKLGAGAAAATSTLNPVTGDNFAYVASYTTGFWTGNLEKRAIDVTTGQVATTALACVEDVVVTTGCTSPSSIAGDGAGGYNCVTPDVTDPLACSGTLDGTNCLVPVSTSCNGTLKNRVYEFSDARTIYMPVGGSLANFSFNNFTAAQKSTFEAAFLSSNLTQWNSLSPTQQDNVTGENLVAYLRGQTGFELDALDATRRVFRSRQAVLGDVIDSRPAFIGKPTFNYTDPGYESFKNAQASRAKTVYIGSNDGMLHAFDADTMTERWAFVPSMVIPNLWKLADEAYASKHSYYVNGDPVISDICISGCNGAGAVWRTILVAGLGGGGRGYYALDITNPSSPTLLWERDASDEPNLGYTYGSPVVTKRPDGRWVVLITSGYNNIPDNNTFYNQPSTKFKPNNPALYNTGDGRGYLYVLDANTGSKLTQFTTGVGSVGNPSGLARIQAFSDDAERNNTASYVYGGDLMGNLWRFDIDNNTVSKFAELSYEGTPQPITTRPELGLVKNRRVVFVGTGKYLEVADLTNTSQQTLYGIKDNNDSATILNPRSQLVQQTIVPAGPGERTSGTNNAVNFETGPGWFVDLPDSGERQNVNSQLVLGTLLVPTTVPTSSPCQPAGYGWFNFFDYRTGLSVIQPSGLVSKITTSPIVGFNVVYVDGKPRVSVVTADNPTPQLIPDIPFSGSGTGFQKTRAIWREMLP